MHLFYVYSMSEKLLELKNITKCYKRQTALDNVSFSIEKGHVYGFVGENGAGKTTTLRIITGLAKQNSGTVELFGESNTKILTNYRKKMGCMIEHPVFDGSLNATDNLRLYGLLYGLSDFSKIPELLERTGLGNAGNKKVRDFSMGMKQRLGIAAALISSPELLILDEPLHGLDDANRELVRAVINEYCSQHRTDQC